MGHTVVWVSIAACVGLLSGCALSLPQFMLISLGSLILWTSAAIFERASLWSSILSLLFIAIAAQAGYVLAVGLRAFTLKRRHRHE